MERCKLLGLVGLMAAGLVLGGLSAPAQNQKADSRPHDAHAYHECAAACNACQLQCDSCARHCAELVAEGKKEHLTTLGTCADCANFCSAAAQIVARRGPLSVTTCQACAKACAVCGAACEKFPDDEHMKRCAQECRKCEKACLAMVEHAGHAPGRS
jgi:hypothetical protein